MSACLDCGGSECICRASHVIAQLTEACQLFTRGIGEGGYYPSLGEPRTRKAIELMQAAGVKIIYLGVQVKADDISTPSSSASGDVAQSGAKVHAAIKRVRDYAGMSSNDSWCKTLRLVCDEAERAAAPAVPREVLDVQAEWDKWTAENYRLGARQNVWDIAEAAFRHAATLAVPREAARPKWRHADGGLYDVLTLNAMFKSIGYDEWQDGYVVYRDDSNQVYVTSKARFDKRFTRVPDAAIANRE